MTSAVELFARFRGVRRPHLAFSFNFTDLPTGSDFKRMRRNIAHVERFCVYSAFEKEIYPKLFGLPPERFRFVFWGQIAPEFQTDVSVPNGSFVVAIGGEGRDYKSIVEAARVRPDVQWIAIARPHPALIDPPTNLAVRYNVPSQVTWGMARKAAAVVVPLRSENTCCGHITIVSAQLLGLPLVTTRSRATEEYVSEMVGATVIEPSDPVALAGAVAASIENSVDLRRLARDDIRRAESRYARGKWSEEVAEFAREFAFGEG
jgi:glycosyltransferase involved in cell wall biosynthesis